MRWHCPQETGFEICAVAVCGRARYLSVTNVPYNIESLQVSGEKHFVSLKLEGQSAVRTRDLRPSKQADFTTAPGPPPRTKRREFHWYDIIWYDMRKGLLKEGYGLTSADAIHVVSSICSWRYIVGIRPLIQELNAAEPSLFVVGAASRIRRP